MFSLVTFNCFGGASWRPRRRLLSLARELEADPATVVCLQEVQSHATRRLLVEACRGYPAHAYAPALAAPRGALLTLGRAPLRRVAFVPYDNQGAWLGPTVMDRMTGKGALIAHLDAAGVPVVVINTHLLANYGADWRPSSRAARDQLAQLSQLAAIVREQPAERLVLVASDFNLPRGSWLYDEFLARSGLADPLAGDVRPTYRPFPGVPASYALPLDFVFVRVPPGLRVALDADLCLGERVALVGGGRDYLSDHIGVRLQVRRMRDEE